VVSEKLTQIQLDRVQLFGRKNPKKEEQQIEKRMIKAESKLDELRKNHDIIKNRVNTLNTQISTFKARINHRKPDLKKTEQEFLNQNQDFGFKNEQAYLDGQRPFKTREQLAKKDRRLEDTLKGLKSRKEDRGTKYGFEQKKKLTKLPLAELRFKASENQESLRVLGEKSGAIKQRMADDDKLNRRYKEIQDQIISQRKECSRWGSLHALIGSADGKKFRNFAQGITFELMVYHANMQLTKMTDRYLLVRDERLPLELNIMDNYQAGEIRSTKNLSGGESFIVSLCLALGLSNMASRNVRVDSLFLDEGFGTLDEDTLETSLEVLSSLHQEGKLIGVISHMSALNNRISTQIRIKPGSSGKSTIEGPGCSAIRLRESQGE